MSNAITLNSYDNPFVGACPYKIEDKNNFISGFFSNCVSGKSTGAISVNGDTGWALRAVCVDLTSALGYPLEKSSFFYHSMGIVTALNFLTGALGAFSSALKVFHAQAIGDRSGFIESGFSFCASVAQSVGGATMLAFRPCALAFEVLGVRASAVLQRATFISGQTSAGVFTVFYLLMGFASLCRLYQLREFKYAYSQEKDKIRFLKGRLCDKKTLESYTKQELIEEAKKTLPHSIKSDDQLKKIGYKLKKKKIELKCEEQLQRIVGKKAVMRIKKCYVFSEKKVRDKTIARVENAWKRCAAVQSLFALSGFMGCVASVAGFIVTGGAGVLALALIWISLVIVPMTIADSYSYYIDLQNAAPGKYDKHLLLLSSLTALLGTGAALILTTFFSLGIIPIILTLFLGVFWLTMNAVSYRNILNSEKASNS
ncbi:MAG: hypothetical protein V4494_02075 [Chlamydiota bacterium]